MDDHELELDERHDERMNLEKVAVRSSGLLAISERLRTQDNRCTENPMFCVQVLKREYGFIPHWVSDTVWILDGEEVRAKTRGAEQVGYKEHWQTVKVAFTQEGCEEYIRLNGHNHREKTRIYVESFNRCPEMIAIREFLMANVALSGAERKP